MHYQEITIVLGTTELQCLGEIRGRVRSWVWQRPTGEFFVNWAGEKHENEGGLLCSGVDIKNSYKHRVQSADIDIIFGPMLKNWEVYDVNKGNAQAMAQLYRYWNISLGGDRQVLHIMICYGGECTVRVKYVPTEQSFSNDSSHCLVLVKNKIKLHLQKTTVCDYLI